jgi:catechol 2,3-dioxygenase-like lactoylglutathione lyase family enzyme
MLRESKAFSGFSVDDVPRAREFYGDTLGLETSLEDDIMTIQLAGGGQVIAYPKDDHVPATFTILNFPVDDIEAAVDALSERGIEFERYEEVASDFDERGIFRGGGPLIAWFKDPAGNVLSVIKVD